VPTRSLEVNPTNRLPNVPLLTGLYLTQLLVLQRLRKLPKYTKMETKSINYQDTEILFLLTKGNGLSTNTLSAK
jgi:hypothetical protein